MPSSLRWHPGLFVVTLLTSVATVLYAWPSRGTALEPLPSQGARTYGWFLVLYLVVVIALRARDTGAIALLDVGWACNLSLLCVGMALASGLPGTSVIVAAFMTFVSTDQFLWYIDFFTYLVTGKFPLGVAMYITWPSVSFIEKATTTHHIWFLPATMVALRSVSRPEEGHPFSLDAFALCVTVMSVVVCICRAMVPLSVPSPKKGAPPIYLNLNLSYECWKDVPVALLHTSDGAHALIHVPHLVFWWSLLSTPFFGIFWVCYYLLA